MKMLGLSVVGFLTLASWATAQGTPTPSRTERLAAVAADFNSLKTTYKAEMDALRDEAKRAAEGKDKAAAQAATEEHRKRTQAIVVRLRKIEAEKQPKYVAELTALLNEDAKDGVACEAAVLLMTLGRGVDQAQAQAFQALAAHHAADPRVEKVLPAVLYDEGDAADRFLADVVKRNPSATCKGMACLVLGDRAERRTGSADTPDAAAAEAAKQATAFYRRAAAEAGGIDIDAVPFHKGKLADLAGAGERRLALVGRPAPMLAGEGLDGKPMKLTDYRGKVVILDFWATWCVPCVEQLPHLRATADRLKGRPFAVVGVNGDLDPAAVGPRLEKLKVTVDWPSFWNGPVETDGRSFPIAVTTRRPIPTQWGVTGWPTVFVIDHAGTVRRRLVGGQKPESLDRLIDSYVAEAEKAKGR